MNMEEKKVKMELVKNTSASYKIVITKEAEEKIRLLCSKVHEVEWSGNLFYRKEGSFEDGSLVIKAIDVFPMDIGVSTYTEFDMSPDTMGYMVEHSELMEDDVYMGLIHSHNNMSTFFSGTDTATLLSEGSDTNHFVSLIVNNAGTYSAGITRVLTAKRVITEDFSYPSFSDTIVKDVKTYEQEVKHVEWFDLKIEFEVTRNSFYEEINNRLEEIKKTKAAKPVTNANKGFPYNTNMITKSTETNFNVTKASDKAYKAYKDHIQAEINFDSFASRAYRDDYEPQNEDIPYGVVTFNPEKVKSIVLQLVTGSIIIPNESKIDVAKFAASMPALYDKRFNTIKQFEAWADSFIEHMMLYTYDTNLAQLDDSEAMAILAFDITESLKELPTNEYIESYMSILETYII